MNYEKIFEQFGRLNEFLNRKDSEILQKHGLTQRQFEYLLLISTTENCTVSFLSELLKIKKPTVTLAINELTNNGLVSRIQAKEDKRFFTLKITRKGKNLIRKIKEEQRKALNEIFSNFSQKDLKQLSWILHKFLTESEITG